MIAEQQMGASLVIPSRKEIRRGFEGAVHQYCSLTLSQVEATFQLWRGSKEYGRELTIGQRPFEEIFGGLFDDCEVHYSTLKLPYEPNVRLKVVFTILGLLAIYDHPQSRIDFIWKIILVDSNDGEDESSLSLQSSELDYSNQLIVNTKQIQSALYFVLESIKILFAIQVPTSYKVDYFVSDLIVSFKVRQHDSIREPLGEGEDMSELAAQQSSSVNLSREEFWSWCQDSKDVIKFLSFPDEFRNVMDAERSSFKTDAFLPVKKIDFLLQDESPLWKYRVVDMVDDTFYEHMPSLDLGDDIFTALEHCILSTSHSGARSNVLPMLRGLDEDEEEWIRELIGMQKTPGAENSKGGVITATQLATSASRAGLSSVNSSKGNNTVGSQSMKTTSSLAMLGASASRSGLASKDDKSGQIGTNLLTSASRSGLAVSASRAGLIKSLGVSGSKSVLGVSASKSIINSSSSKSVVGGGKMLSASSSKSIISKRVVAMGSSPAAAQKDMFSVSSSRSVIGSRQNSSVTSLMRGNSSFIGIRPEGSNSSMRRVGSKAQSSASTASLSSGGKGEINEFCGLFDITLVVAWLASCCPPNMVSEKRKPPKPVLALLDAGGNPMDGAEEKKEEEPEDDVVRDSAYYKKLGQTGHVNVEDLVDVMKHVAAFKNHAKQRVMELWTELGVKFASSDLAGALFDEETPIFSHRPLIIPTQFLTLENTIYNVLEILADGHKGVPLCTDPERPDRVTHVVDGVCVGNFLYHHDVEFFGSQLFLPVMEAEYVRKASHVPRTWNFATTITALKDVDTESMLITDDDGKVCGLVSAESAIALWRAWWAHCNSDLEGDLTMDEMRELYSKGIFSHFDGYPRGFSVFSALVNQLDRCNIAGVHVECLDASVEEAMGKMMAKAAKQTAMDRKEEEIHRLLRYASSSSSEETDTSEDDGIEDEDDDDSADPAEKEDIVHKMHKPAHARGTVHHPPAHRRKSFAAGRRHAPPSHSKPSGRAPRRGSRDTHGSGHSDQHHLPSQASKALLEAAEELEREKERLRKEKEQEELEQLKKDLRAKAVEKWLSANHAVAHNSNLQTVLQRMHEKKITKVYVINIDDGYPLGSVHITDLCRKLLRDEAAQKINGFGAFRRRRHLDIVVQNVDI